MPATSSWISYEAGRTFSAGEVGWVARGAVFHIDVRGDRVWFQHDGTSTGVANDLIARGVPEEHSVLALHPPEARLTG